MNKINLIILDDSESRYQSMIHGFMRKIGLRKERDYKKIIKKIDLSKISNLSKNQIGYINSYFRDYDIKIRISVFGYNVWELWYCDYEKAIVKYRNMYLENKYKMSKVFNYIRWGK